MPSIPEIAPGAQLLQGWYEWLRGRRKRARTWWLRSLALAESMEVRYDLGRTLLEAGRRLNERAYLQRADAIFSRIGASWELARTRKALG